MPSREESINSLGAVVQHNLRHTLLVPSREENTKSLGAVVQHNHGLALPGWDARLLSYLFPATSSADLPSSGREIVSELETRRAPPARPVNPRPAGVQGCNL